MNVAIRSFFSAMALRVNLNVIALAPSLSAQQMPYLSSGQNNPQHHELMDSDHFLLRKEKIQVLGQH
jgi:hypothetical protein